MWFWVQALFFSFLWTCRLPKAPVSPWGRVSLFSRHLKYWMLFLPFSFPASGKCAGLRGEGRDRNDSANACHAHTRGGVATQVITVPCWFGLCPSPFKLPLPEAQLNIHSTDKCISWPLLGAGDLCQGCIPRHRVEHSMRAPCPQGVWILAGETDKLYH